MSHVVLTDSGLKLITKNTITKVQLLETPTRIKTIGIQGPSGASGGGGGGGFTQEDIEDIVGAMVDGNSETLITVQYNDAGGKLNFAVVSTLSSYVNDAGFITGVSWGGISGTLSNQADLQTALNGKSNIGHGHAISDVTGLQAELDAKLESVDLSDINQSGAVDGDVITWNASLEEWEAVPTQEGLTEEQIQDIVGAMVEVNTESLINVEYDDGAGKLDFSVVPTLSSYTNDAGFITGVAWGDITGTLSDQTDLQDALDLKADVEHTHDVEDLNQSGAVDGDVIKWNASLSEWEAAPDETGGDVSANGALDADRMLAGDGVTTIKEFPVTLTRPDLGGVFAAQFESDDGDVLRFLSDIGFFLTSITAGGDLAQITVAADASLGGPTIQITSTGSLVLATSAHLVTFSSAVSGVAGDLDFSALTENQEFALPDKSGTIALLDDIEQPLTTEEVQDIIGAMVETNTESLINVEYDDEAGKLDFSVVPTLSSYTNDIGFITGVAWGDITGTLSDQTDLQDALDLKADVEHTHDVADLNQSGAVDGDVVKWNASLGEWEAAPEDEILDLSELPQDGAVDGDVITWNASLSEWEAAPIPGNVAALFQFNGDGVTTVFDIGETIGEAGRVLWFEDGVWQQPGTHFTVSGSEVTRTEAPVDGAQIYGVLLGSVEFITPGAHTHPLDELQQSGAVDGDLATWNASLGEWEPAPPANDAVELIESGVVSNQAALDILNLSTDFISYELIIDRVIPVTDNVQLWLRVSEDNGATFRSGAGNYFWVLRTLDVAGSGLTEDSDTKVILAGQLGNATNEFCSGEVRLYNLPGVGDGQASVRHELQQLSAASSTRMIKGTGRFGDGINAIRLQMSSGNISSMEYALYGYRK